MDTVPKKPSSDSAESQYTVPVQSVDPSHDEDFRFWAMLFNVWEEQLHQAVRLVGTDARTIANYLDIVKLPLHAVH